MTICKSTKRTRNFESKIPRFLAAIGILAAIVAPAQTWAQSDINLARSEQMQGPVPTARSTPGIEAVPSLKICSFDSSRSPNPFATTTGDLGYGQIRATLLDPAKFGPAGTVKAAVSIAPGIATLSAATLAGCAVFITSQMSNNLSTTEATALSNAVKGGMAVIADANSDAASQAAVNSILSALGTGRSVGPASTCTAQTATEGVISNVFSPSVFGPFGNLSGGTFATSLSAVVNMAANDITLVTCSSIVARAEIYRNALGPNSGRVMVGGDPSGEDLFTKSGSAYYNANNEKMYLNFIADAVGFYFPGCFFALNQSTYTTGQTVAVNGLFISNPNNFNIAIDYKLFIEVPNVAPLNQFVYPAPLPFSASGSTTLAANMPSTNVFSGNLFTVTGSGSSTYPPKGSYRLGCQLADSVSGWFYDPKTGGYTTSISWNNFTIN